MHGINIKMSRDIELMVRNTKNEKKNTKHISIVPLFRRTIENKRKIRMNEKILIFAFLTNFIFLKDQNYKTNTCRQVLGSDAYK